jgi:hypothetical protein
MSSAEIDNILDLLDAFADRRGGGREQACFHAAKIIRELEAENARLRKDRLDWVGATFHEEDRVAELEAENAKLAAFAREIIEPAFDGQDVDGATIQRVALHYGLLAESKYDPEKHGSSFAEPGDQWFTYAGPLAPPNAR